MSAVGRNSSYDPTWLLDQLQLELLRSTVNKAERCRSPRERPEEVGICGHVRIRILQREREVVARRNSQHLERPVPVVWTRRREVTGQTQTACRILRKDNDGEVVDGTAVLVG